MMRMDLAIRSIDWAALRDQKQELVNVFWANDASPAWGVINLLDAIQDAAVQDGIATEQEVFGDLDEAD